MAWPHCRFSARVPHAYLDTMPLCVACLYTMPLCVACRFAMPPCAQVWAERPFTERDEYGLMGQAIQGIELMYNQVRASKARVLVQERAPLRLWPSAGRLLSRGDRAPPKVHAPQPGVWKHEQRIRRLLRRPPQHVRADDHLRWCVGFAPDLVAHRRPPMSYCSFAARPHDRPRCGARDGAADVDVHAALGGRARLSGEACTSARASADCSGALCWCHQPESRCHWSCQCQGWGDL